MGSSAAQLLVLLHQIEMAMSNGSRCKFNARSIFSLLGGAFDHFPFFTFGCEFNACSTRRRMESGGIPTGALSDYIAIAGLACYLALSFAP
jgi:hypothetical protein